MPCCRHNSAVASPASPCFKIVMICSSLCRVPFICVSPSLGLTQNPKSVPKGSRGILGRTVLERREDYAKESAYGRANRGGVAAGRSGREGGGDLSEGGDQRRDVLRVEKTICGAGSERTAGVAAVAR